MNSREEKSEVKKVIEEIKNARQCQLNGVTQSTLDSAGNDINKIKRLLLSHNEEKNNGWSNLHLAVINGLPHVVELLAKDKAEIDKQNEKGITPLYCAVASLSKDKSSLMVKLLLDQNANPNIAKDDGTTPLYYATQSGKAHLVKLLLEHKADPNASRLDGSTSFICAAQSGSFEIMKMMFDHGAIPVKKDKELSYLDYVADKDCLMAIKIFTELLKEGKDIASILSSSLDISSEKTRMKFYSGLLQNILNENVDDNMAKIIFLMSEKYQAEFIKSVIDAIKHPKGDDAIQKLKNKLKLLKIVTQDDHNNLLESVLYTSINEKQRAQFKTLYSQSMLEEKKQIEKQKSIDNEQKIKEKNTELHTAIEFGSLKKLTHLLSKEEMLDNINFTRSDGHTPISLAIVLEKWEEVLLLLDHNADFSKIKKINEYDRNKTIFHFALESCKDKQLLEKIIKHQKLQNNFSIENIPADGASALSIAIEKHDLESVKHIVSKITSHFARSQCSLLMRAIQLQDEKKPNTDIIKILLQKFHPNWIGKDGKSALHVSAEFKSTDILDEMIEVEKVDVNQRTEEGATSLHLAAQRGNVNNIVFLLENAADPSLKFKEKSFIEIFHEVNPDLSMLLPKLPINIFAKPHENKNKNEPPIKQTLFYELISLYLKDKDNSSIKAYLLSVAKQKPSQFAMHLRELIKALKAESKISKERPLVLSKITKICNLGLELDSGTLDVRFGRFFKISLEDKLLRRRKKTNLKLKKESENLNKIKKMR